MVILQVVVLFILVLATAFFAGKKIGQRRHNKVLEQMKLLEKKYDHMLDDMSKTSLTCSEIIEKKTTKLIDLLEVIDQKCLYADDVIANLEEASNETKMQSGIAKRIVEKPKQNIVYEADDKFKTELKEALSTMYSRIMDIENSLKNIKSRLGKLEAPEVIEKTQEDKISLLEQELHNVIKSVGAIENSIDKSLEIDGSSEVSNNFENFRETPPLSELKHQEPKIPNYTSSTIPNSKIAKTEVAPDQYASIDSTVREVLEQLEDGTTIPQIARNIGIGKGEIDLIINIYGNSIGKGDSEKCL